MSDYDFVWPDEPIFISAQLVGFAGGHQEAILLSRLWSWGQASADGWVTKTIDELTEATALSRARVNEARRNLRARGFITERYQGTPPQLGFRVNPAAPAVVAPIFPPRYRKQPIPPELRSVVFERDGHACRHCGSSRDLHADHIVAESRGGPTSIDNLQTLCRTCNMKKGARP